MDISSPSSLWRDYDPAALPLNATELSKKTDGDMTVREYYYDGLTTTDGRIRAFVRIYEPHSSKGVILYMSDTCSGAVKDEVTENMLIRGYTVAVLDYTGKSENNARYTLYPESLKSCNCLNQTKFIAAREAINSRWYIWTCMARRAVLLLKSLYEGACIFTLGKELGGSTIYKLASFDDGAIGCATLLNVIPDVTGEGNTEISYRAALGNPAYATLSHIPLFMAVCSNTDDGMLDKMSELAHTTASLKCFRIVKRAGGDGICVVFDQLDRFFSMLAEGKPTDFPRPSLAAVNSENKLYFNIKIDGKRDNGEIDGTLDLFAAFCIENPANRNWTNIKASNIGDGEYIAHADVLQSDKPVYAFINLTDRDENVFSSPITTIIPKNLGITAQKAVKRRLIYDGGMGTDVWTSSGGGDIMMKHGPYGIDGISSENNSLITYKPGDYLYRADPDALLQILISGKSKKIELTVSDGAEKYTCDIQLASPDEWNKLTLSPTDFKSANGPLDNWSRIVMIKFTGDDEFLISSALWV